MRRSIAVTLTTAALLPLGKVPAQAPDFTKQVQPILEAACVHCHCEAKSKGDYRMDTLEELLKPVDGKAMIVPGKADESKVYTMTVLPHDDDDIMPPTKDGPPLSKEQAEILKAWVNGGAKWPDGVKLAQKPRVIFEKDVQPILEMNCLSCHNDEKTKGDYNMVTKEGTFKGGEDAGTAVTPFDVEQSSLFKLVNLPADDDDVMPPKKSGVLSDTEKSILKGWIEQGACWPEGVTLKAKEKKQDRPPNPDNFALVQKIHAMIMEKSAAEKAEADMKEYKSKVPKTGASYTMVPIKAGEVLMGSPDSEPDRNADEGNQKKVKIEAFWMGKYEVTWDEYLPFQVTPIDRFKDGAKKTPNPADAPVDVVASPTTPYTEMSFGMGQDGYPAISMAEHGALKYCQWLSAQTGHFYRLPTDAEWEYACRAGSTTAYSFGDDASKLGEYAWYYDNSPEQYQLIGKKKPNAWGLHDMHGNVMEWVLDRYDPNGYKDRSENGSQWANPPTLWGRTARGGSWNDDAKDLRSAARRFSVEGWKQQDPQLPRSMWYLTDTKWLGFRLVRPLRIPSAEEMFYIWNCGRPEQLPAIYEASGLKLPAQK